MGGTIVSTANAFVKNRCHSQMPIVPTPACNYYSSSIQKRGCEGGNQNTEDDKHKDPANAVEPSF